MTDTLATNPALNETTIRVPKKYQHMIASIHAEDGDYWAYTAPGYYSPMMQTGTIHEYSQKAMLEEIRTITPCGEGHFTHCQCGHDCLDKDEAPAPSLDSEQIDHQALCDHPSTPKARAACRKARAADEASWIESRIA